MKKTILIFLTLITASSYATSLPIIWKSGLETNRQCQINASFWTLDQSPFAYLKLDTDENVPMHLKAQVLYPGDVYVSISQDEASLGFTTYELFIPKTPMSILPWLTISYSGVQQTCFMDYVNEDTYTD